MLKEFNNIDTNGDGMLSNKELYTVYVKIFKGNKIKAHQVVDELFQSMDIDRSGKVDFSGT
jgi:Ca2+-binding EF-hand superfamily protein